MQCSCLKPTAMQLPNCFPSSAAKASTHGYLDPKTTSKQNNKTKLIMNFKKQKQKSIQTFLLLEKKRRRSIDQGFGAKQQPFSWFVTTFIITAV